MAPPPDHDNPDSETEDFAAMFAESEQHTKTAGAPSVGDVVSGPVISISSDSVFIDLGGKSEGVLEIAEVTDDDGEVTVAPGDTIQARVVDAGDRSGVLVLRRSVGKGREANAELQIAFEHEIPVEGVVEAVNKGGFDIQIAGARAFCPVSQIDSRFVENPEEFIGQRHEFRITRFEEGHRGNANIVVSRRILLEAQSAERAADTRTRLEPGAVFRGVVKRIENYGAFVDIGGIEGMLHISELGYSRVEHPSEVVELEQEIEVQVLRIEQTDNPRRPEKIGLSLKSLMRDPWDDIRSRIEIGQRVMGTVARVEQFGAFVEVAPGIEGLVHISEMGGGERLSSPRKVVSPGQVVGVKVLSIDLERHRISLSMDAAARDADAAEERDAIETYAPKKQNLGGSLGDLLQEQLQKKK